MGSLIWHNNYWTMLKYKSLFSKLFKNYQIKSCLFRDANTWNKKALCITIGATISTSVIGYGIYRLVRTDKIVKTDTKKNVPNRQFIWVIPFVLAPLSLSLGIISPIYAFNMCKQIKYDIKSELEIIKSSTKCCQIITRSGLFVPRAIMYVTGLGVSTFATVFGFYIFYECLKLDF